MDVGSRTTSRHRVTGADRWAKNFTHGSGRRYREQVYCPRRRESVGAWDAEENCSPDRLFGKLNSLKVLLPVRGRRGARVAADTASVHTPTMTLKNAALLALIGTILMTALLVWTFVFTFLNVLRDLVPAVTLLQSFIYAFGSFSVAVFFYVFHRAQQ
jgi:hypothetical protein